MTPMAGGPFSMANTFLFDGESVLFGRKGTIDRPRHQNGKFWTIDTMYYTVLGPEVQGRWLYYWATTVPYGLYSTNTALPSMTSGVLGRLKVPVLHFKEQQRIADYLDRETAEIEEMDAELDRTIQLLRERRDVNASGLNAMGHDARRLKWLMVEIDDRACHRADELPLLSVSIHHGVQLRDESTSNQAASADLGHYKVAEKGDIVLNRMRAFQGGLGVAPVGGLVSPDYAVLRVDPDELSPAWAEYVMRSPEFIGAMAAAVRGIGSADQGNVRTPRINVTDLFDLAIPFPALEDQLRLIDEMDAQTARIDDMIADAQRLKALLAERRSTLITEVVTGRKEVPA